MVLTNKNNLVKILIVEDDDNLGYILKDYLEMLGYSVTLRRNGVEGLKAFNQDRYNLCIIDVMMPVKDGFSLAQDIRSQNRMVPIIFITAKNMREDRIRGFKAGADDYITKPFSTEELSLRVEAILRRTRRDEPADDFYTFGKFTFDYKNQKLMIGEKIQNLTKKENELIHVLVMNANQLVKREFILESIWGKNDYFVSRSMDVYITKLRKYFSADPNIEITNIHGTGYRLEIK